MPRYEIGGLTVNMTPAAAQRWNSGFLTQKDLRASRVYLPAEDREITLLRAVNERLEPEISEQIYGMPANPLSDLVRGRQIFVDLSGVGHCWVETDSDSLPASVREEIEAEIEDGTETCAEYRAKNGLHYSW